MTQMFRSVERGVSRRTREAYKWEVGCETTRAVQHSLPKVRAVLQWVGSDRAVLDLGCNDGGIADQIRAQGNWVIGCDFPEFAATARDRYAITAVGCDLTSPLPFASEKIDVVVAVGVMEFIPDDRAFLAECNRVLRPGGQLILSVLNLASLVNRLLILRGKDIDSVRSDHRVFVHRYTTDTAAALLGQTGFRIIGEMKCPSLYDGWRRLYSFMERLLPSTFSCELAFRAAKL